MWSSCKNDEHGNPDVVGEKRSPEFLNRVLRIKHSPFGRVEQNRPE